MVAASERLAGPMFRHPRGRQRLIYELRLRKPVIVSRSAAQPAAGDSAVAQPTTAVFTRLIRAPELAGKTPSRHIPLYGAPPRKNDACPAGSASALATPISTSHPRLGLPSCSKLAQKSGSPALSMKTARLRAGATGNSLENEDSRAAWRSGIIESAGEPEIPLGPTGEKNRSGEGRQIDDEGKCRLEVQEELRVGGDQLAPLPHREGDVEAVVEADPGLPGDGQCLVGEWE